MWKGKRRSTSSGLLVLALTLNLTACVTPEGPVKKTSEFLPRPDALVQLREVSNASGAAFEVDAETMLRDAMVAALKDNQLYSSTSAGPGYFILDVHITEYRPGNAFKRWLMPFYGSTVLTVRGELTDSETGALAASIDHSRSVHAGGAFSIGAWDYIFSVVADEITEDLQIRITQGGQFVVSVRPRAEQKAAPELDVEALKVRVLPVVDERNDKTKIGTREAAFGVSMGDVHLARRVPDVLQEALIDDLLVSGLKVVDSGGDRSVQGTVTKFWVHTDTTALYWDVIGDIELRLAITSNNTDGYQTDKVYSCQETKRTFVWPSATLIGDVLDACIADMMEKIRSDTVWKVK